MKLTRAQKEAKLRKAAEEVIERLPEWMRRTDDQI